MTRDTLYLALSLAWMAIIAAALGRGLIKAHPWPDGSELNEAKLVGGEPVVARRHPATLFNPVEKSLDPVTSAVEIGTEADRIAAIAFRRDVGPRALLHGKRSDPVGVIATGGQQ